MAKKASKPVALPMAAAPRRKVRGAPPIVLPRRRPEGLRKQAASQTPRAERSSEPQPIKSQVSGETARPEDEEVVAAAEPAELSEDIGTLEANAEESDEVNAEDVEESEEKPHH